jgi:hypothetical protein
VWEFVFTQSWDDSWLVQRALGVTLVLIEWDTHPKTYFIESERKKGRKGNKKFEFENGSIILPLFVWYNNTYRKIKLNFMWKSDFAVDVVNSPCFVVQPLWLHILLTKKFPSSRTATTITTTTTAIALLKTFCDGMLQSFHIT